MPSNAVGGYSGWRVALSDTVGGCSGWRYDNSHKGALTSLNLANNKLEAEGAKHVAEAIKLNVSALRFD